MNRPIRSADDSLESWFHKEAGPAILDGLDRVVDKTNKTDSSLRETRGKLLSLLDAMSEDARFRNADFSAPRRSAPSLSLQQACERVVADPEKRTFIAAAARVLCRAPRSAWGEREEQVARALTTGDSGLGQAVAVAEPLAADVYSLLLQYSAFRTLGVVPLDAGKKKLASVTGKADAIWLTPANQGTAITADASITGASISPEVATVGTLVEVSGEALADGKTTFEGALLMAIIEGLGYRIDWACFQADGTDDTTDGAMTGIFAHESVPNVSAAAGNTSVATLGFDDFVNCVAGVTPSALQRPCRWWISPSHLPSLLKIKDGIERLLKVPTIPGGDWTMLGFPVTFSAAAPSTDAAAAKVAAFGRGDAFTVALRQDFEIRSSASAAKWQYNIWLFRAIARARCIMRDATSFSVLKLAGA